ncbi:MAG: hypothetical protein IPP66_09070 [Anaerolineales bacterium]|nr:hypothetical protein [Anaerolineales bacterium]
MEEGHRFTAGQRLIRVVLLALFLWQVVPDVIHVTTETWNFFVFSIPFSNQYLPALLSFIIKFFGLMACYLVFVYWFAQFVLPVNRWQDRGKAAKQLFLFSIHRHGAAVFVRDGDVENLSTEEREKNGSGIAFVDLRSAITLDKHLKHKNDLSPASLEQPQKVHFDPKSKSFVSGIRVAGPGLTFLEKKEKIVGTVDLRKQTRGRKNVQADTRDGIRVTTDVPCTFTIGQPPDVLDVCLGGKDGKQIFVIEWESSLPKVFKKIKSLLPDELDPRDQREILEFISDHPDPSAVTSNVPEEHFPYSFDEKRVEKAVYSHTQTQEDPLGSRQPFKKWSDWPQDVAVEEFRILLAKQPYMKLYSPDDQNNFPLKDFKKELKRKVRNTGILAYRVATLRNGSRLQPGRVYTDNDLIFYPSRELTRHDVLRFRGIKVLDAGIGELEPIDPTVRKHLLNSWLSSKQKEVDVKYADYRLEIARVRSQARVKAQQSMIYHLTQLLENQAYPREALALLIYQELEATAANPETRKLLPEDTLSLLTGIGTMLLSPDGGAGRTSGATPIVPPQLDDSQTKETGNDHD